jgi:serine/threonine protein kinase
MRPHGRYAVVKKVADGGMAEIFLARQSGAEGFSRLVIVKRILPAFSADPHFRNMLVDEAHIAMTLNHTHIVPVLDLGQSDGCCFMVLELVDGWDLATIRQRATKTEIPLPIGIALYLVAEVCRALAYAHGRKDASGKSLGIVHRDVSPQNVLVSEQGEVKVADFGIAKALGKREETQTGVIKGKLEYMSPEQARGAPLDASSDIFAVGTLLYLLATNHRPFASASDIESLLRVQRAEFAPPEQVSPQLSPAVVGVVKKAMMARPADRYRSAEEMMVAVEAILRAEYGSPGQSELKRWLGDLGKGDGALPVSRRPGMPAPDGVSGQFVVEGEMLALEGDQSVSGLEPTAVRASAPAPLKRPISSAPPALLRPGPPPLPPGARRPSPGWLGRSALVFAAVTIVLLLGVRLVSQDRQRQLASSVRALMLRGVDGVSSVMERSSSLPAENRGGGHDSGLMPSRGSEGDRPARTAERLRPPPSSRVTVTLLTRPSGASVVGPDGSLGTTPLPWTVPAGTTLTMTFAKAGFAPATRRVSASGNKRTFLIELRRNDTTPGRGNRRR